MPHTGAILGLIAKRGFAGGLALIHGRDARPQLLSGLKNVCAAFPDKRKSEGVYSMADIGLSAFSLFFMQSESFLSYQRALEEGRKTSNCQTLFGMERIPTDNHIRGFS